MASKKIELLANSVAPYGLRSQQLTNAIEGKMTDEQSKTHEKSC